MLRAKLLGTTMLAALLAAAAPPAVPPQPAPAAPGKRIALPALACAAQPPWTAVPRHSGEELDFGRLLENWISVAPDGALTFNGSPAGRDQVANYLRFTMRLNPRPLLVLNRLPGTGCGPVRKAAALAEQVYACDPGLCWLTAGDDRLPIAPPAPPPRRPPRRP